MRPVSHAVEDNSLSALSFDFLGVFPQEKNSASLLKETSEAGEARAEKSAGETQQAEIAVAPAADSASKDSASGSGSSSEAVPPVEQTVVLAQGERLVRVVSAPRRHAWGAMYVLRTLLVVLVVFCVGSLVLTMILNPDLTFTGAVSLLVERASGVVLRLRGLFA